MDGLFSFSYKPLQLPITLGLITCCLSFVGFVLLCIFWSGIAALLADIGIFVLGTLLICLGIAGGYLARISDEARRRPNYVIGEKYGFDHD